jgi:hypothetical protein
LSLLSLASCGDARVDIGDIVANPRVFDGRQIAISGEVPDSLNILVVRAYTVRDRTGEILVVTDRALPKKGERVTVSGQLNQAFALGDKSLVIFL